MKKAILLALCLLLLSGCSNNKSRFGEITEVYPAEDSGYTELLFRDSSSDAKIGLVITDETDIDALHIDKQKIRNGEFSAAKVMVERGKKLGKSSFDELIKLYEADNIHVVSILEEDQYTLSDGTMLDVWRSDSTEQDVWRLKDGTELLLVQEPVGPEHVSVMGTDASFDDLPLEAQERISEYYAERGLLYDLNAELEAVYTEWQEIEEKEFFSRRYVSQSISPVFANESIICFLTSVYGDGTGETRIGDIFNKETGEYIDVWDMFSVSEEEVRKRIFTHTRVKLDPKVIDAMQAALKPEYILFYRDFLEINFPSGTLPENRNYYNQIIDYDDILYMLNEWAIPPLN